jgi:ribosomal protein S18 acetylase RimI-like enzyme
MVVRHLGDTDFKIIMECFLSAFENYFVKMPTDHNFYKERWKAAGLRFELSYGMFDDNILVGFIINAVDERQGEYIAYNSGTGVIPKYRGKRIVKAIYDYAIPDLINNGITKCLLEVITENVKAIKSYEGIGFKKCKHYKYYGGVISVEGQNNYRLKEVTFNAINWQALPNQELYSWDNQKRSLEKGNYKYFHVLVDNQVQSFFTINPKNRTIAQLEVLFDTPSSWNTLFLAIQSIARDVRISNIDDRLTDKIKAVESAGLKNTVNQYEMEVRLK